MPSEGGWLLFNTEEFYQSIKWKKKRQAILRRDNYLCKECKKYGRITEAKEVHHIVHLEDSTRTGLGSGISWDFDTLALLAKSSVFNSLAKAYDQFRIKRVRGCIDLNTVPKLEFDNTDHVSFKRTGVRYAILAKVTAASLDLRGKFQNPLLCCAFDRRCTLYEDTDDPFSYGSALVQAKLPGTSIHLCPDVIASTLQERMSFIPTTVLSRYRNFVEKKSNQIVFDPTFHIRYKHELSGGDIKYKDYTDYFEPFSEAYTLQDNDVFALVSGIKLHCMFYVDLVFEGIRDTVDEDVSDQQLMFIHVDDVLFRFLPKSKTDTSVHRDNGVYGVVFGGTPTAGTPTVFIYREAHGFSAWYTAYSDSLPAPAYIMYFDCWIGQGYKPTVKFSIAGLDEQFELKYQTPSEENPLRLKTLPQYYFESVSGYLN